MNHKRKKLTLEKLREQNAELRRRGKALEVRAEELRLGKEELAEAQANLEASHERYANLYEHAPVGYLTLDRVGNLRALNLAATELLGRPQNHLLGRPLLPLIAPSDRRKYLNYLTQLRRHEEKASVEVLIARKDASLIPVQLISTGGGSSQGARARFQTALVDLTERREKEEQLRKLNRTLLALGHSNQALMHADDETAYLQEVCAIIVEDCGHELVWIGFAEQDEGKSVRLAASAGLDQGYLETMRITWADTERGCGPTGKAIRTGEVCLCRNILTDPSFEPWREQACKRGYASSVALPLLADGKPFGAVTIYAPEPDAFAMDEIKLLTELTDDLAYGIGTFRTRAAKVRAEAEAQQAADQRRLALEAGNLGTWDYHFTTGQVFWDKRCREMFGVPAGSQISYDDAITCIHPEDRAGVDHAVKRALDGIRGGAYHAEFRVVWPDGSVHWLASHGRVQFEGDGDPKRAIRFTGVVLDITARKQAEANLLRAKQEWERTFDSVPDLIAILDGNHRIVRANRAMAERLSLRPEECIGRDCFECVHGLTAAPDYCPHLATLRDGGEHMAEMHEDRLGGDFLVSTTPLHDEQGRLIGTVHVARDVTALKQAEQALRQANEELEQRVAERTAESREAYRYARSLLECSVDPLVTISPDGKITDVNKATEEATGVPRRRLIGSNFADHFTEPDKAEASYRKVIAEGLVRDYPLTICHATGRSTEVLYNATLYRNEVGEVQGVLASARDVTEHRRMEAAHVELLRRLAEAEETERGRISRELHDRLGQDLTALKLGLQLLRKQGPFASAVQESIGKLEQLADGLVRDIHRLAWELRPPALDDFGLEAVLRRYTTEWSEGSGVPVDFHCQGLEAHRLPLDLEATLYRITQEALTNVVRHAHARRVGVLLERRPDYISLIVEDDGDGFDPEAVMDASAAQGKLGLLGMQERVTLVRGTLEIESKPGAGTTVFVRVPPGQTAGEEVRSHEKAADTAGG